MAKGIIKKLTVDGKPNVAIHHGMVTQTYVNIPSYYRYSCQKSAKGTCFVITRRGKPMPLAIQF